MTYPLKKRNIISDIIKLQKASNICYKLTKFEMNKIVEHFDDYILYYVIHAKGRLFINQNTIKVDKMQQKR